MRERLRDDPAGDEEQHGGPDRRLDAERTHENHKDDELEQPEWQRDPAGLVREQAVVELGCRERRRP